MKFMNKNKSKPIRNIDEERAEKLAHLGAQLRQAREEQQLSLDDIAARTMIGWRTLHAIEEGKLQYLPEPIYTQGFIRRFADALGINGAAFASDFPTETSVRVFQYNHWVSLPIPQFRPLHLYLLYIVLILCSVQSLSDMINRSTLQASSLEVVDPTNDPFNNGTAAPIGEIAKATPVSQKSSNTAKNREEAVRIGLTLKADSWIQVEADGKTEFEGILREGTQRTWEAKQQLIVRAGNAGGVLVTVNNGETKQMGKPGELEEVRVKANPKS